MSGDSPARMLRFAVEDREPELVAAWIGDAMSRLLTGQADDLAAALGLPGAALRDAGRLARDHWLREAGELAAPGARPWAQAGAVLRADRATAVARARAQRCGLPPGDQVAAAIAFAERFGPIPATQERLFAILKNTEAGLVVISVGGVDNRLTPPMKQSQL